MARLNAPGKYQAEVVNAYMTETDKGSIGYVIEFMCAEGTMDHTRWVTPNNADYAWNELETLGFTHKHAENIENLDRMGEIMQGHSCQIVCAIETYNGEDKLKVKYINPVGGMRARNPETKSRLHSLLTGNSMTRGLASAPRSSRPAQQEMPPNSPNDDSSVPF